MTCLGVLDREERGDGNGTSLKEGGLTEIASTVLPYTRCSFALKYLPLSQPQTKPVECVTMQLILEPLPGEQDNTPAKLPASNKIKLPLAVPTTTRSSGNQQ